MLGQYLQKVKDLEFISNATYSKHDDYCDYERRFYIFRDNETLLYNVFEIFDDAFDIDYYISEGFFLYEKCFVFIASQILNVCGYNDEDVNKKVKLEW